MMEKLQYSYFFSFSLSFFFFGGGGSTEGYIKTTETQLPSLLFPDADDFFMSLFAEAHKSII